MESKNEENIKILSYNILAQTLLGDSLQLTNEEIEEIPYLGVDYRFNKIVEKIEELKPDVCLFQEFEQNGKMQTLFSSKKLTYEILFKKRPGNHQEGCAIAYDKTKFRLENYYGLEFQAENKKNVFYSKKKGNPCLYNKENVAVFALLESYKTKFYYLIICSHLLFNNSRGDIKLGQIYQLIKSALLIKNNYKDIPIITILGADLNSTYNSAIYDFITSKSINVEFLIKYNLSGQNYEEYISSKSLANENYRWFKEIINTYPKFDGHKIILITKKYDYYEYYEDESLILENKLIMKSFYKEKNGKEPKQTSYSKGFQGTFDFLFYNTNYDLKIQNVLEIPEKEIKIPNENNPSDHFPLFVDFNIHN